MGKSIIGCTKLALAIAVLAAATLLNGSLRASADEPRMDTLQLNQTNTVESLCDFPLVAHEEGTLKTFLFFDQDGQVVRIAENWQDVATTLTNPANGTSLTYRIAGRDDFSVERDGDVNVFTQGLRGIITVPGSGAISGEAGELTLSLASDGTLEVRRSGFLREGDLALACSYLQGTP
jgi:hypothetical protein